VTTYDNRSVILPNSMLSNNMIVNISREGNRRLDIDYKFSNMPTKNNKKSAAAASRTPEAESALKELFIDEIKDIYWAEKHLASALPKLIKGATSEDLKQTITTHLEETKNHVTRLESVFESIGEKAAAKKCLAMEGLLAEATELLRIPIKAPKCAMWRSFQPHKKWSTMRSLLMVRCAL
jgi:hypothetical protein